MGMDINDILNSTSTAPLTQEELNTLTRACYVINADSPTRIRENPVLVRHCICFYLDQLDLNCINFSNPNIVANLQHLEATAKLKLLNRMQQENLDLSIVDPSGFYRNIQQYPHSKTIAGAMDMCNPENGWKCAVIHEKEYDELTQEEKEFVEKIILHYDISFDRLPCTLSEDREFMDKYVERSSESIYPEEVDIFTTSTYDKDLEQRFAESYGCKTVEEVVQVISEQYPELQDHLALATVKLYTLKYMERNIINTMFMQIFKCI